MNDALQDKLNSSKVPVLTVLALLGAVFVIAAGRPDQQSSAAKQQSSQDFEVCGTQVEPIFVKQRENGVRCDDCHSTLNTRLRLELLAAGSGAWTETEAR